MILLLVSLIGECLYETQYRSRQMSDTIPYSGKFVLRVKPELHKRLAMIAQKNNISLNRAVVALIQKGLSADMRPPTIQQRQREDRAPMLTDPIEAARNYETPLTDD
jgi:hypothetical protein